MIARATGAPASGWPPTSRPTPSSTPCRRSAPAGGVSAFLTVQEGCDKFCTFCVVPYTRGAEFSRPAADVEAEARRLVERGAREITLLGQNVNAYHGARAAWPRWSAVWRASRASTRIRYTTSHPRRHGRGPDRAPTREVPSLMPYLHLPGAVRLGPDAQGDEPHPHRRGYLRLVERLRAARPDIALSSDFIVGFPGETRRRLRGHARLVREVRLRRRLLLQIFAPPRHAGRRHVRQVAEDGEGRAAGARSTPCSSAAARVQRRPGRPHPAGAVREARSPSRPDRSAAAPTCRRCTARVART